MPHSLNAAFIAPHTSLTQHHIPKLFTLKLSTRPLPVQGPRVAQSLPVPRAQSLVTRRTALNQMMRCSCQACGSPSCLPLPHPRRAAPAADASSQPAQRSIGIGEGSYASSALPGLDARDYMRPAWMTHANNSPVWNPPTHWPPCSSPAHSKPSSQTGSQPNLLPDKPPSFASRSPTSCHHNLPSL